MNKDSIIKEKYEQIKNQLNERSRRIWAASESLAFGHGGIAIVAQATGLARSTIWSGKKELTVKKTGEKILESNRIRKKGGGRKRLESKNKKILKELDALVEIGSRGDPESPLRWTTKSTRNIAGELSNKGFSISHVKVASLLEKAGFSLQATRKTNEGKTHADRDAQFNYINSRTIEFQKSGLPVVSVDAKKKELVGKFANTGREYRKKNSPEEVNAYDFPSFADGRATPYGVYDISLNKAWVNVGISKDTAQFAVSTLRNWWNEMGRELYRKADKLLIHADGGGSNGYRNRLWKMELQKFAKDTGLEITVCHLPAGTSKWNKIEHRLFAQISKNWRGRPLESFEVIVNLIGATTTSTGLVVKASIDHKEYKSGIKVSDENFKNIKIQKHKFHGKDWNYTIKP
jgi:transposase